MSAAVDLSISLAASWEEGRLELWAPSRIAGVWMPVAHLVGPYGGMEGA